MSTRQALFACAIAAVVGCYPSPSPLSQPEAEPGRVIVSSGPDPAARNEEGWHTVPDTGANRVDPAGTNLNTGANVQGRRPVGTTRTPGMGLGSKAPIDAGASSGLNETATGTGTTTNTGTNTENAGTGGTDDPKR